MRTMTTIVAMLLLTAGVGRADPPSGTATSNGPVAKSLPVPAIPPIPSAELSWKKPERIDTPAPLPHLEKPADKGGKDDKPEAKKLKDEMEKLLKETDKVKEKEKDRAEPTDERTRLRNKLDELVERLDQQKKSPKLAQPKTDSPADPRGKPTTRPALPEGGKPVDLVRAAGNLYKAGDTEGAYELLRVLDTNQMPKEDRAFADYVRAACLRKMGKTNDALKLYRAIADAKDDLFLADSAVVQMTAIQSARDLETQLEQLKSRRKMK